MGEPFALLPAPSPCPSTCLLLPMTLLRCCAVLHPGVGTAAGLHRGPATRPAWQEPLVPQVSPGDQLRRWPTCLVWGDTLLPDYGLR